MNDRLEEMFARIAVDAESGFSADNADAVISRSCRRVRRHRTAMTTVSGISSVAVLGAVVWGAGQLGDTASPAPAASGTAPSTPAPAISGDSAPPITSPTASPPPSAAVTSAPVRSADDLFALATPRLHNEERPGDTGALLCDMDPADNPHLIPQDTDSGVMSNAIGYFDCDPYWVPGEAILGTERVFNLNYDSRVGTVTLNWYITNPGTAPISIDSEGIVAVLESDPSGFGETIDSGSNMAVATTSTWNPDATVVSVVQMKSAVMTLGPNEVLQGTSTWISVEDDDLAATMAKDGVEFIATLRVRVPFSDPQDPREFQVEVNGPVAVNSSGD